MIEVNTCTNDKQVDISIYLDILLSKLGFVNITKLGVFYYKQVILLALSLPEDDLKLNNLISQVSQKYNKPKKQVRRNINSIFEKLDISLMKKNFSSLFHIDFNYCYTTPKNLLFLIINCIYKNKSCK